MLVRPATWPDVRHVMETMWQRGRDELTQLGVDPVEWLENWKARIARGDAIAFEDHAILGCDWESEDTINTSFQASASFELPGIGRQVTKALRREIPRLMSERGIRVVCTYSLCIDPDSPKWFRLLGMIEDTDYRGMTRRFVRRANVQ